jgi:asparagine synthetase B (glutamine-hydrolysing)
MWKNLELNEFYNHEFDFSNQHKDTYEDWLNAFEEAVKKRAVDGCFLGLSSGYDSGALSKELVKQGVKFRAYAMYNHENKEILDKRLEYIPNHLVAVMNDDLWQGYYDFLKGKINDKAMKDHASMGVAFAFETAKNEGITVCISGQGGDEVNSDYALFPMQSHFKGKWPQKLYEWPNFRWGMQVEYLAEIEDIAELYGIEVRYPFLDINLAQEFLWLTPELKNKHYKATIHEYLTRNGVPFEEKVKRGFNPIPKKNAHRLMK